MPDEAAIAAALAELANQDPPNILATAKRHKIDRMTLSRRYKGQSEPKAIAHLNTQGRLTAVQEEALIGWIDELSARKLPPTPAMITTYVERLLNEPIGKNWVYSFYKRREQHLKRKYLSGLDADRVYATASRSCYEIWYQNVRSAS